MKALTLYSIKSILLLILSSPILQGQHASSEPGIFREADYPFPLPEGVIQGENFKFGYVSVPEIHSQPEGKAI